MKMFLKKILCNVYIVSHMFNHPLSEKYRGIRIVNREMAEALNETLSKQWAELRGIQLVSFGMNTIRASDENGKCEYCGGATG